MVNDQNVAREMHIHGKSWDKLYDGYFANPQLAAGYVAAIMRVAEAFPPSAIVDLGGGTGFILEQLLAAGLAANIRLINMDESNVQLDVCRNPRITLCEGSIQSLRRAKLVNQSESLMLICRSVLHYGGIAKLKPWLAHLREQLQPGEWFVHQSGCADDAESALALDVLLEMVNVEKWAPPKDVFLRLLAEAKFRVADHFLQPPLGMSSDAFALRYGCSPADLAKITADLRQHCANLPDLCRFLPDGFIFNFPYRVFVCQAIV